MNRVILKHHDVEKVEKLVKLLENTERNEKGLLSFFRPMEEDQMDNWYEWKMANWGTKWDVDAADVEFDQNSENELSLNFETAWTPPVELFHYIEDELGWEVIGYYYEPGANFVGRYSYGHDECHCLDATNIDSDILEPWECYLDIPEEIEDEVTPSTRSTSRETSHKYAEDPDSEV